ncbi:hypothetical protein [Rubritalea sp.]|uniref:hypothetical protein n=1 Tax=Rubritalea sp. TaxID=2109375 RepID=UPI003EF688DD
MNLPIIEKFEISQGLVRVLDDRLECAIRFESEKSQAALSLKGEIAYESDPVLTMGLDIESVSSKMILGEPLAEVFRGDGSGEGATVVYNRLEGRLERLDADLSFTEMQFYGFPFLAELSKVLRKQWYRRPTFTDEVVLQLEKNSQSLSLNNMRLIQRDRLIILGDFTVASDDSVSGEIKVGVPIEHKKIIESSVKAGVFSTAKDGYLWESIVLSGKLGDLSDDFTAKVLSRSEVMNHEEKSKSNGELLEGETKSADDAFNELLED